MLFFQPADEGASIWRSLATLVKGELPHLFFLSFLFVMLILSFPPKIFFVSACYRFTVEKVQKPLRYVTTNFFFSFMHIHGHAYMYVSQCS